MGKMKKGQVTIYVAVGIVLVILVMLLLYLRGAFVDVTPANVRLEIEPITGHVTECIQKVSETPIDLLAKRGGHLNPTFYRMYNGEQVSYLCQAIPGDLRCANTMLTVLGMEKDLEEVLDKDLNSCLDVEQFSSFVTGIKVTAGVPKSDVIIRKQNVEINVDFPVTVKKKDVEVSERNFNEVVDKPLGDLYDVSQDILDYETQFGNFDQLIYMLSKKGNYVIYKKRPYPDKLYIINDKDKKLTFQFFVQGESLQK